MKYRKKPVVIDAVQWTGTNTAEILNFAPCVHGIAMWEPIVIPTLEGDHTASVGDFIIKGVAGEFYPCKPAIFEQTYEMVYPEVA